MREQKKLSLLHHSFSAPNVEIYNESHFML